MSTIKCAARMFARLLPRVTLVGALGGALGAQTSWPTKGWPTTTPKAVGLNAAVLDSIDAPPIAIR